MRRREKTVLTTRLRLGAATAQLGFVPLVAAGGLRGRAKVRLGGFSRGMSAAGAPPFDVTTIAMAFMMTMLTLFEGGRDPGVATSFVDAGGTKPRINVITWRSQDSGRRPVLVIEGAHGGAAQQRLVVVPEPGRA